MNFRFWKALIAGTLPAASSPEPVPDPIPPSEFSECFMAEFELASDDYCASWKVISLQRICIRECGPTPIVYHCWAREDAIELMKRLDPIEKERVAALRPVPDIAAKGGAK